MGIVFVIYFAIQNMKLKMRQYLPNFLYSRRWWGEGCEQIHKQNKAAGK